MHAKDTKSKSVLPQTLFEPLEQRLLLSATLPADGVVGSLSATASIDLYDAGEIQSGCSPAMVLEGNAFSAWCDVANGGAVDSGGFNVNYYASTDTTITVGDHFLGSDYVSGVTAGGAADSMIDISFPSSIPVGMYYAGWIIDTNNDVAESDEGNNVDYHNVKFAVASCEGDCDFDDDVDAGDINAMLDEVIAGTHTAMFDLNGDGLVTSADADRIVCELVWINGDPLSAGTEYGDANLDGEVDLHDLALLASNWDTPSGMGWVGGDFTGEGGVDLHDLSLMAVNWGFSAGAESTETIITQAADDNSYAQQTTVDADAEFGASSSEAAIELSTPVVAAPQSDNTETVSATDEQLAGIVATVTRGASDTGVALFEELEPLATLALDPMAS